ncbi:MAG: oxidoreductase [Planctomycetaceae bacterium]|nr:oxidoreductase [Planctomycetaceae bacterium]
MAACPRLAVFKFASCDGCQLSLLSLEDELLTVADRLDIVYFLEATSRVEPGPYDIALVEGSITTPDDLARIEQVRRDAKYLVTIGACATAGGIQALRNWGDSAEFLRAVYATPSYIESLATSTPISAHVRVDFELRGCPIDKYQLLEVLQALLAGRRPRLPAHSVCLDCKRRGTVCVVVAQGVPCLGPVTHAGCGAICPSYDRGCYGCYGPCAQPNLASLTAQLGANGATPRETIVQLRSSFNGYAAEIRAESDRLELPPPGGAPHG